MMPEKAEASCKTVHPLVAEAVGIMQEASETGRLTAGTFVDRFENQVAICGGHEMIEWFTKAPNIDIVILKAGDTVVHDGESHTLDGDMILIGSMAQFHTLLHITGLLQTYCMKSYRGMFK